MSIWTGKERPSFVDRQNEGPQKYRDWSEAAGQCERPERGSKQNRF